MRSALEVFRSAGAISFAQEIGLTLLKQDSGSALAATPSGSGEGVYEGSGSPSRAKVLRRKTDQAVRTSARGGVVVIFNLYRLRSGKDPLRPLRKCAPRRSFAFVVGYTADPPSVYAWLRDFVATHASVPVERRAQFARDIRENHRRARPVPSARQVGRS